MKNPLFLKCVLLTFLGLFLLIPLSLVENTIRERTYYRQSATDAIAASTAGKQTIAGPVMTIPVTEEYDEVTEYMDAGVLRTKTQRRRRVHTVTIFPSTLDLTGNMNTERRAYGLHETTIFELTGTMNGKFSLKSEGMLPEFGKTSHISVGKPAISIAVNDVRGLIENPTFKLEGKTLPIEQGVLIPKLSSGFHVTANDLNPIQDKEIPFTIQFKLLGTNQFGFIPLAGTTTSAIKSDWPHPSFGGNFLPRTREVTDKGFSAKWSTTSIAAGIDTDALSNINQQNLGFSVELIEPVDIYRQAERAAKYGLLFIVLTFAAFFMFENLKRLPIHPIQYLLVGLAQATFFLLLTSLSEHIQFPLAYSIAAVACIALINIYLSSILRSFRRSLGFTAGLALLYSALYGILCSEQNALLLGTLLIFTALAGIMIGTRRINWYQLGKTPSSIPD